MATRVYIGKLPADVRRGDIEDLFRDYGRLYDVRIMGSFGFVEFEHPRDAEDAVKDLTARTSWANLRPRSSLVPLRRSPRPSTGARVRRGQFRCIVSNLPPNTSWQDLKDIGREHGSISFADVDSSRPDEGVIEYDNREDYERALDKIEGIELRGYKLRIDPARPPRDERDRSPSPRPPLVDVMTAVNPVIAKTVASLHLSATDATTAEAPSLLVMTTMFPVLAMTKSFNSCCSLSSGSVCKYWRVAGHPLPRRNETYAHIPAYRCNLYLLF
ncbi:related to pre-mrna splicing factor srp55 [Ustilago trichophora]|uniref:Related to pre-mrna splicing factor srp55 n=1 Tax=Ustilago trichophora TaxID=86804 RepID=A0A5C3EF17_9BASI|nr:related to pre-mrna splicing factor srp55 [Ustilago trichophora]